MLASQPGNMRGPRVKTPLLLLLLLLTTLTGTVVCPDEDDAEPIEEGAEGDDPVEPEPEDGAGDTELVPTVSETTLPPDFVPPDEPVEEVPDPDIDHGSGQGRSISDATEVSTSTSTEGPSVTDYTSAPSEENLGFIIIPAVVALVIVIIGMIVCGIFINRRWNKKTRNQEITKEDPFLDGSSTEKVPMPMFEEDVPSVLELEMEELDQWMKKDGEPAVFENV